MNWDLVAVALATAGSARVLPAARPGRGRFAGARRRDEALSRPACSCRSSRNGSGSGGPTARSCSGWTAVGQHGSSSTCPFAAIAPTAWLTFFRFNGERGADFDSLWYIACRQPGLCPSTRAINVCVARDLRHLGRGACGRSRLGGTPASPGGRSGLPLLVLFLLSNKVYSPQYGLWLLPWFALALPRLVAFLAFSLADVAVFVTRFSWFGRLRARPARRRSSSRSWCSFAPLVLLWCVVCVDPARARADRDRAPGGRCRGSGYRHDRAAAGRFGGHPRGRAGVTDPAARAAARRAARLAARLPRGAHRFLAARPACGRADRAATKAPPAVAGWPIEPGERRVDAPLHRRGTTGRRLVPRDRDARLRRRRRQRRVLPPVSRCRSGPSRGSRASVPSAPRCWSRTRASPARSSMLHGLTRLEGMSREAARLTVLLVAIFPTAFFFMAPYTRGAVPAGVGHRRSGSRAAIDGRSRRSRAPSPRRPAASGCCSRSRSAVEAVHPLARRRPRAPTADRRPRSRSALGPLLLPGVVACRARRRPRAVDRAAELAPRGAVALADPDRGGERRLAIGGYWLVDAVVVGGGAAGRARRGCVGCAGATPCTRSRAWRCRLSTPGPRVRCCRCRGSSR